MSATDAALPNATRPTKGARWGGAVRVECPHCHVTRPKNHQPFCKQNPHAKQRIPPAAAIHIAARNAQEPKPVTSPPPPSAPPTAPPPAPIEPAPIPAAPAPATPPREVPIPLREVGAQQAVDADAFMKARTAELSGKGDAPVHRVTPRDVQVDAKPRVTFTPSPLLIKLAVGTGVALAGFLLWRSWRNNRIHDDAAKQQARGARKLVFGKKQQAAPAVQEPQKYVGPRAWTPEPERVATDIIPGSPSIGGGYVPSPQTAWSQSQDDVLRGRAGRP